MTLVGVLWLLFGNRIGAYVRFTEEQIREVERKTPSLHFRVKTAQRESFNKPKKLHWLERIPSSGIIRTALPASVCILWVAIFVIGIVLALLQLGTG
jgi:hypothetical protein